MSNQTRYDNLNTLKPKSITENKTKACSLFSTRLAVIKEREAEVRIIYQKFLKSQDIANINFFINIILIRYNIVYCVTSG